MVKRIEPSPKDLFHLERLRKIRDFSNSTQPKNYKNRVVLKPWGYEYLIFENEFVATWFLHINGGHSTSMHCHPQKKTSLILLSGNALCNTFEKRNYLNAMDAIILEKTVFHSTKAISSGGIDVIEIETPPDKTDLVRLNDGYGRQKQGYEGLTEMRSNNLSEFNYFYFDTPKSGETFFHHSESYHITLESYNISNVLPFKIKNEALYTLFEGQLSDKGGNVILEIGDTIRGEGLSHNRDIRGNEYTVLLKVRE